jgi:hypothetical protein
MQVILAQTEYVIQITARPEACEIGNQHGD